jgi:hypothetical protein
MFVSNIPGNDRNKLNFFYIISRRKKTFRKQNPQKQLEGILLPEIMLFITITWYRLVDFVSNQEEKNKFCGKKHS